MIRSKPGLLIGLVLVAAGAVIPAETFVLALRTIPPELRDSLLLGGLYLKLSLIVVGLGIAIVSQLPIWNRGKRPLPEPKAEKKWTWIVLALLAGAAILRLPQLGSGLWLDEIYTFINYARAPYGEIVSTYASENQHFLFTLLAHAAFNLFGETAAALRVPAVLFGVASIGALYLLGTVVTSRREAIFAAALMAVSYHHIWFSQNGRGYTGLLFWALLSSYFLVRARETDSTKLWIAFGVSAALGVYTHMTMLFVIAGQFLVWVFMALDKNRPWQTKVSSLIAGFGTAAALMLLLHAIVIPQVVSGMARTVSVVEEWKNPLWTLLELARGLNVNFAIGFVALAAVAIVAAGMFSYMKSSPVVVYLFVFPVVIGAATVISRGHHLWPRFFFFAFGFGTLILIRGISEAVNGFSRIVHWKPERAALAASAACFVLVAGSLAAVPKAYGPKQDYEGARKYVESEWRPGDAIVTVGLASIPYKQLYKLDWQEANDAAALNLIRSQSSRTWVLYTLRPVLDSVNPDISKLLDRDFTVARKFNGTLQAGTVVVCLANKPAPVTAQRGSLTKDE